MRIGLIVRAGAIITAAVMLLGNGVVLASTGSEKAALRGAAYIEKQIHEDGGYGAKESTIPETSQVIIALKAAGGRLPRSSKGKTPIDYLKDNAKTISDENAATNNVSQIAQMIIALKFAGQDPEMFAGTNWLELLSIARENASGWYGNYTISHIWAMLALESCEKAVDDVSIKWLVNNQEDNGGFALEKKGSRGADTNTTAIAIQALIGAGEKKTDAPIKKAIEYLMTQQNKDGGFPFVTPSPYGTDSDCSSTSWVIQALIAADEDIEGKAWVKTAITPMGFLMSLQNSSGAFMYQKVVPEDSVFSTSQAILALMETPFPYRAPASVKTAPKTQPQTQTQTQYGLLITVGVGGILVIALILLLVMIRKKHSAGVMKLKR